MTAMGTHAAPVSPIPYVPWSVVLSACLPAAFVASTLPGVRVQPGYSPALDGVLGTLAAVGLPLTCLLRGRRARGRARTAGLLLALALLAQGLGSALRVLAGPGGPAATFPPEITLAADLLRLVGYPAAVAALALRRPPGGARPGGGRWWDGLVGGLTLGLALAAAADLAVLLGARSGHPVPPGPADGLRIAAGTLMALSTGRAPQRSRRTRTRPAPDREADPRRADPGPLPLMPRGSARGHRSSDSARPEEGLR
jgi:hypothetical protein